MVDLLSAGTESGRIGISEPFEKPEFLSIAYRSALDAIRLGLLGQRICSPPIEAAESPEMWNALIAFNHDVLSALETGRFESIPAIVEQYFSGIAPDEPDQAFNSCLYSIHHVMDHFGIDPFTQVKLKYRFDLFGGTELETMNAIKATFMHNMVRIVDYIRQMEGNPADFIIRKFREIVDSRFYQQDLTLLTISEDLHISYGYLSKLVRQKLGTCFTEYLTAVRMANARKLLHDGSMRVFEVADAAGYSSDTSKVKEL